MKLQIVLAALVLLSAFLPVELFISEAPRPIPDKVVTQSGVVALAAPPMWLYAWRAAVVSITLLFAAIVATFFIKPSPRARLTLAFLSILAAFFHYLTLVFTSQPPGYGVAVYPLFYTMSIGGATQLYLDIGQILIIYAVYNIYKIRKRLL